MRGDGGMACHFGSSQVVTFGRGFSSLYNFCFSCASRFMAWPGDLSSYGSLSACRTFFGVADETWTAFTQAAGDPGEDVRLLAALPPLVVAACAESATPPSGVNLSPVQAAQCGLVYRLARRKVHNDNGLDLALWLDPDPWGDTATSTPMATQPTTAASSPDRKMKYSQILDQSDDTEFIIAGEHQKQLWLQTFINKTGGLPLEAEEPSTEQISALQKRITAGLGPYADFALFLPYGKKAIRAQKYRTYLPSPEGGYIMKEVPGPSSFVQWQASFRVYRTALLMLEVATMATLVAYESHVEKLSRLYQGAWHLIVAADDLARADHLTRLRVAVQMDVHNGITPPPCWDTSNPWEALFRLLVKDQTFWQEQVHVPANAWLAHGSKGIPLTPAEAYAANSMHGGTNAIRPETEAFSMEAATTGKRTRNQARREGKKKRIQADREELQKLRGTSENKGKGKGKDKGAPQLCYAWNNNNGACAGLPPGSGCQGR